MFFSYILNETKSIFDIADDWNKVLSLVISIGTVLVSVSSLFYFTKSISIEDPTKYTFKDVSEKDRYVILKPAIITITTIIIGFILGLFIVFCLTFNKNYQDVFSAYILSAVYLLVMGICLIEYYRSFLEKISGIIFYIPKKICKSDILSKKIEIITLIVWGIISFIIQGLILGHLFGFNSILYIVLYSLITSFYAVYIFMRVVGNSEDILFAKALGSMLIIMAITLTPGFIHYIKINQTQIMCNYIALVKIDDFIDKIIQVSIDGYFIISCVLVLISLIIGFLILYNKIVLNYNNRQNLAYFYAKRDCDEKDIYIYGKLDDYFIYDTKDYIKCNYSEQEDNINKINKFKAGILKNNRISDNDKKEFNDLVDDMFYYIKYLNSSENEMKNLIDLLASIDISSAQNLDRYKDNIKNIFKTMEEKVGLQFITINEIKDGKIYNYRKNIKKFYNSFK